MPRVDKETREKAEAIEAQAQEMVAAAKEPAPAPMALQLAGMGSLAPVADHGLAGVAADYADVFEQIDDIAVSGSEYKVLRLAQGMSAEVSVHGTARPGDLLVEGHEPTREVLFLPISYKTKREYWAADEFDPTARDTLMCQSQRRLMRRTEPELFGTGNPGGPCGQCPLSLWQEATQPGGKNRPPKCTLIHILIGVSLTHECRVELSLKKTSERTALDMLTIINTRGPGNVLFKITTENQKNQAGQPYWILKSAVVPDLTPEMVRTGAEIARREKLLVGY